ncbi:unnamed protein product, partial [Candidula unifasciata]
MSDRRVPFSSTDEASVASSPRAEDEQERVQKKTFTNWMNTYLCQNLFEDVKDGTVLLSLLEVLSGEKL